MTTIAIQQRAGGDTVRALGELATTLDARKDLRREVTTLLSGVVFTSYVVAGVGGGTILLLNVMSPGVTKQMTSSFDRPARDRGRRRAVVGRVRADPQDDEDRRLMPLLFGALTASLHRARAGWRSRCCATPARSSASAGGSAACASPTERTSVTAKLVEALAARLGPRLAPSLRPAGGRRSSASSTTRAGRAG